MIDIRAIGRSPSLIDPPDGLQRLQDINAIKDIVGIYPILADTHNLADLVSLFTVDGEFHRAGDVHRGHAELRSLYDRIMRLYSMMIHTQHQHIVQVADDGLRAEGLTMGHSETVANGVQINGAFRYDDLYVKEGDYWKFSRRRLRYQYMSSHDDMAQRLVGASRVRLPGMADRLAEIPEDIESWQAFARDERL